MARFDIDKARVRKALKPRREPYWGAPIDHGLALGFRRIEHGGTWVARFHDDGKHRYHSLGHIDVLDYQSAVKGARKWSKTLQAGIDTSKVQTVADACREYVEDRLREKGETSARATEGHYQRYVYGCSIGKVKLSRLTTAQLKRWRSDLDMAPATRNRVLAALKAALNYAVASRYVDAGRAIEWKNVKRETVTSRRDLYLDRAQRHLLIEALPGYAQPFVRLLSLLPVRPGALAACTVADFNRGMLTVRHDKANGGRVIPLTPAVVAILKAQAQGKLPAAPLVDMNGDRWDKSAWVQLIKRTSKKLDLPTGVCAYTFRHSVITDMLVAGMDSLTVARIAGTSLEMLERHYGHLLQQHAVDAMAKLAL